MTKWVKIILHIAFLYGIFKIGTWIQDIFNLSIPGSVIGMLLLFLLLAIGIIKMDWIKEGTELLIKHLPLLFIPVTVGIIDYLDIFQGKGLLLIIIVLVSTVLVMLSASFTSQYLMGRKEREYDGTID